MRTTFGILVAGLTLACADGATSPGAPPEGELGVRALAPCNKPKITATPASVTRPRNSGPYNATFLVKNNCATDTEGQDLTASRTGRVTSVSTPSPPFVPVLRPGESRTIIVSYNVGSVGTGTVVLTGTNDLGTLVTTGTLTVTVN